jgi:hypothetical protein
MKTMEQPLHHIIKGETMQTLQKQILLKAIMLAKIMQMYQRKKNQEEYWILRTVDSVMMI